MAPEDGGMTAMDGRRLTNAGLVEVATRPERVVVAASAPGRWALERLVHWLPLAAAAVGVLVGFAALLSNQADALAVPALALLALSLVGAVVYTQRRGGSWDRASLVLAGLCGGALVLLLLLPEWMYGLHVNGIIHRSVVSVPLLLLLSALAASRALRSLGVTPSGADLALYPLLGLPIALALLAYGVVLGRVLVDGLGGLRPELLTTAWQETMVGQPGAERFEYQLGFLNNILGTLLLVFMTSLVSILPGVGAGVFLSEYPGRVAKLIDFAATMLRAMSVFIVGAAAFGLVHLAGGQPAGTFLSDLFRGSYQDAAGGVHPGRGSFVTASLFLSMLVIPIIAKMTEEGLRSVPREIREASVALGATEGYGLRRILLPWAAPNILTALLLGAAEASGSLAVVLFIAGTGQHGVGPLDEVTSLDYAVFATTWGPRPYIATMGPYQFTAALLLLILTLGLTVAALWVRQRFGRRYRGTLT
jgi:phosphate transport system permease protein